MTAGNGFAGPAVLAGGETAAFLAIDEDLKAGRVVGSAQAHEIGRAFIAECGRQSFMHRERRIGERDGQLRVGFRVFDAAMCHARQVGGADMAAAVFSVGRRRDGGGVGRPHRTGRGGGGKQARVFRSGAGDHLLAYPDKPHLAQETHIGPIQRQQETLGQPQPHHEAHLGDALQCSGARARRGPAVARTGEVAERERRIIVARPDQAVEVDFADHGFRPVVMPPPSVSAASVATGKAQ